MVEKILTHSEGRLLLSNTFQTPDGNFSVDAGVVVAAGTVQAAGYKSSDATAGATEDVVVTEGTLSFKNGLFVSFTPAA